MRTRDGFVGERRRVCPRCSGSGVPVVYGLPDDGLAAAAERGEVEIGGCVIPDDVELFTCPRCRELWSAEPPSWDSFAT